MARETHPIEASLYDALYTSVAEATGRPLDDVAEALIHRNVPDDALWSVWDAAVAAAADLYLRVEREGK